MAGANIRPCTSGVSIGVQRGICIEAVASRSRRSAGIAPPCPGAARAKGRRPGCPPSPWNAPWTRSTSRAILPEVLQPRSPARLRASAGAVPSKGSPISIFALRHDDPGFAVLPKDVDRQDPRAGLLQYPARRAALPSTAPHVVRRDGGVAADGHFPGGRKKADAHVVRGVARLENMNAVSELLSSRAIACICGSVKPSALGTTPAGFPRNFSFVKAST